MSATAAAAAPDASAKKGGGKKKLIMMVVIAVVVLAIAGVGAMVMMKKKAAAAADDADGDSDTPAASQVEKRDPKHPPAFVPLDPFTVNLADRDAERYAQVGITLEVEDAHVAEDLKTYMPAIRNNILMVLAQKSANDLRDVEGKQRLAFEIKREASRALGVEIDDEMPPPSASASGAAAGDEAPKPKKKKKKKQASEPSPIRAVQFSTFIIQ